MRKGCYDWTEGKFVQTDSGGWYGASREVIAYYMDPRNFLNANDIYVYMKQSYDSSSQTVAGIEELVKGSFLDAEITDENDKYFGKRYAAVIRYAGSQSKVNAYVLASTILQEQGFSGSTLSKGTEYNNKTVYNFFNFGASGSNKTEVLKNGKKYAYEQGWFTPTESIVSGAIKYGSGYIAVGQDTYFYKNYNILNPDKLWHQYAQNVADSVNTSKFLKNAYIEKTDMKLTFRIPVYEDMPKAVSPLPEKSKKFNNYYFSNIEIEGLTPSFNRYTFEYSLSIEKDESIFIEMPKGAAYVGKEKFELKKGQNAIELSVKSETGYNNTYLINIDAATDCTVTIMTEKEEPKPDEITVTKGDTNGDNKISTSDLANVRLHLLGLITLKDNNLKGADTNMDGKITTSDLANIRLHLLGLITLK
jgi:beta-N-acetylglucosaminidase